MVSLRTLTAVPVEVLPRPAFANELAARLRAVSSATAVAFAAALLVAELAVLVVLVVLVLLVVDVIEVVPATAWVACVPLTAPPEVLT
jgi:hypothetical protein